MPEQQVTLHDAERKTRKVSIHERSVHVGNFIIVNGYRVNRALLKEQFARGGYQAQETPHFLLFTREARPSIILVHWFTPEELNINISHHLVQELKTSGIIKNNQCLGELMTGIIGGTQFPGDVRRAWNYFGANTLQYLLTFVSSAAPPVPPDYGTLSASATLYQRVCQLCVGERFLDAGCNGGFLSLLLAKHMPFVGEAIGVDLDASVFRVAQELAQEHHLMNVRYVQGDLLDDLSSIGVFDTVTALHVLEHFTEEDMYRVLANLLQVTAHRLILAVPYEPGPPEIAYEHKQLFSREKLESVGAWCIAQLQGSGRMWYEDLAGGLLLIERYP